MPEWKRALSALTLDGPYSKHGGQRQLAAVLGVHPDTVNKWMLDYAPPSPENQARLAELAAKCA